MKSRVIFIIVPSYSSNEWLNKKMMQVTTAFISLLSMGEYPIEVVSSYDQINNYLDRADLLVVSTAGNVIVERDHLRSKIDSFPSDVGLMGHLLQFEGDRTPYMHEQFFIINTAAFSRLRFNTDPDIGIELLRSEEDMHDGHAPLTITYGTDLVFRELQFGTELIDECLYNGFKVRNFDSSWRYPQRSNDYVSLDDTDLPSRGYCYPLVSTNIFAEALKHLELLPGLDEAQELLIKVVQKVLQFNVLNVWQYDATPVVNPADTVICTANGFLGELIALNSSASTLVLYDKNPNNIEFKQHLYSNWDGVDYDTFAASWASDRGLAVEPSFGLDVAASLGPKEEVVSTILKDWKGWVQSKKFKFVHCDLINDIDTLLAEATPNTILHTSTILNIFPFTALVYDEDVIEHARNKITDTGVQWIEA